MQPKEGIIGAIYVESEYREAIETLKSKAALLKEDKRNEREEGMATRTYKM